MLDQLLDKLDQLDTRNDMSPAQRREQRRAILLASGIIRRPSAYRDGRIPRYLIELLADHPDGLTAYEITPRLLDRFPGANRTALNATLQRLCDEGALERCDVPRIAGRVSPKAPHHGGIMRVYRPVLRGKPQ